MSTFETWATGGDPGRAGHWRGPTGHVLGWVGYDASCPVCSTLARRWGPVLGRRGYRFVPLQAKAMSDLLGLMPGQLPGEIQLVLGDGRVMGGTDALLFLASRVGWMRPMAWLARRGWVRPGVDRAYRWLARNRHCLGDACEVPLRRATRGHAAFFETP